MIRVLTFQSPCYFKTKHGVEDQFMYAGAFLDISFERIIRELGIVKDEDEYITLRMSSVVLQPGDTVTCELLIAGKELEFLVLSADYEP